MKAREVAGIVVTVAGCTLAFWMFALGGLSAAGPYDHDLAEESRVGMNSGTSDALQPLSSAFPARADRRQDTDESTSSGSVPTRAVAPGRDLLLAIAGSIGDDWLPTPGAFRSHVDYRIEMVAGLGLSYVRLLLADELLSWPLYNAALQGDGCLADVLGMPTAADVRRLWRFTARNHFAVALWHWHRAAEAEEYAYSTHGASRDILMDFSREEEFAGSHAWSSIFHEPDAYLHWAFLMRVAERHAE